MASIDVLIETPKGSVQKFDYDKKTHFFKMSKILSAGMVFPYDLGFIPDTKGEDGDPLVVIVISEFNSFPGVMMKCRVIVGIKAEQSDDDKKMIRNDRFFCHPQMLEYFRKYKGNKRPAQTVFR